MNLLSETSGLMSIGGGRGVSDGFARGSVWMHPRLSVQFSFVLGENGGEDDKQAVIKGCKFDSTTNRAASASGSVWMHPRLSVQFSFVLGESFVEHTRGLNSNILKPSPKATVIYFESATRKSASKQGLQQDHHRYMNGFGEPLPSSHSLLG
ncbi:hypothetical protein Tco_1017436 [Tanacetum coccineum]|uniref:Uncharacterized protein n=1 Tax=Tanacetum coccineum TaxID=301880 RepID=A0ABQ5FRJ0_9ASTR